MSIAGIEWVVTGKMSCSAQDIAVRGSFVLLGIPCYSYGDTQLLNKVGTSHPLLMRLITVQGRWWYPPVIDAPVVFRIRFVCRWQTPNNSGGSAVIRDTGSFSIVALLHHVQLWSGMTSGPAIIYLHSSSRREEGCGTESCLHSICQNLSHLADGCLGNVVSIQGFFYGGRGDLAIRRQEVASVHAPNSNLCSSFKKKIICCLSYLHAVWEDGFSAKKFRSDSTATSSWKYCWHYSLFRH